MEMIYIPYMYIPCMIPVLLYILLAIMITKPVKITALGSTST